MASTARGIETAIPALAPVERPCASIDVEGDKLELLIVEDDEALEEVAEVEETPVQILRQLLWN